MKDGGRHEAQINKNKRKRGNQIDEKEKREGRSRKEK